MSQYAFPYTRLQTLSSHQCIMLQWSQPVASKREGVCACEEANCSNSRTNESSDDGTLVAVSRISVGSIVSCVKGLNRVNSEAIGLQWFGARAEATVKLRATDSRRSSGMKPERLFERFPRRRCRSAPTSVHRACARPAPSDEANDLLNHCTFSICAFSQVNHLY